MKTRIHLKIDDNLIKIMKRHCKCEHIYQSDFIAEAIAEKLGIKLNSNHSVDEEYYIDYQIREIDNCIDNLKAEKKELQSKL